MFSALIAFALVALAPQTVGYDNGEDVLRQMRERYDGDWYETFTFVQEARFYSESGEVDKVETWYESMRIPGKLRIDIWPISQGRGVLFNNDVVYGIEQGQVQPGRPLLHSLLLMGFDLYRQPADTTIAKVRDLGINLSRTYETTWQGRDVIVLGSSGETDTTSFQFWIDKERLVFVRELNGRREVQFNAWKPVGDAWVAAEVVFLDGGRMTLKEIYQDMRFDVEIEDGAFSPQLNLVPAWVRAAS